jgi:hypothetical protein
MFSRHVEAVWRHQAIFAAKPEYHCQKHGGVRLRPSKKEVNLLAWLAVDAQSIPGAKGSSYILSAVVAG